MKWRLLGAIPLAAVALSVAAAGAARTAPSIRSPSSFCSKVVYGGTGRPDYLVVSDLALQVGAEATSMVSAIKYVLAQHGFRAGRYSVGYQACDN